MNGKLSVWMCVFFRFVCNSCQTFVKIKAEPYANAMSVLLIFFIRTNPIPYDCFNSIWNCFATCTLAISKSKKIASDVDDFRNELDDLIRLHIFC